MARKRGSRFRKASDAQEQYQDLHRAQDKSRKKRTGPLIERTGKSDQREKNAFKKLCGTDVDKLKKEFD